MVIVGLMRLLLEVPGFVVSSLAKLSTGRNKSLLLPLMPRSLMCLGRSNAWFSFLRFFLLDLRLLSMELWTVGLDVTTNAIMIACGQASFVDVAFNRFNRYINLSPNYTLALIHIGNLRLWNCGLYKHSFRSRGDIKTRSYIPEASSNFNCASINSSSKFLFFWSNVFFSVFKSFSSNTFVDLSLSASWTWHIRFCKPSWVLPHHYSQSNKTETPHDQHGEQ